MKTRTLFDCTFVVAPLALAVVGLTGIVCPAKWQLATEMGTPSEPVAGKGITYDIPTCTYDDPCAVWNGVYPFGYCVISCRSLPYDTRGSIISHCTYYWCDSSATCSTNQSMWQEKQRTRSVYQFQYQQTPPAYSYGTGQANDQNTGCCLCNMPGVG